jgi:hypothetical protein
MNKIFTTLLLLFTVFTLFSQAPDKMNYQAVLQSASGDIRSNTSASLTISVLQGSSTGTEVYSETKNITTNDFGLINTHIGSEDEAAFGTIDWSNGPYFLEISVDGTLLGTSQLLSVPYAFHAGYAEEAGTADYNNLTNTPDFTGWDQDTSDDFDGQYSSLSGAPPAFWMQNDTNLYYSAGNVAININEPIEFGGAALHVGGAIRYAGLPNDTTAGLLFYDPQNDGVFKYVDNTGTVVTLGEGDITYTGSYESNVSGDLIRPNDYVIMGSMGIGMDVPSGYDFGFNTLVFAENNLRLLFDDTDTVAGYPANDWQFEFNESANGGTNHFAINDITSVTTPFKVMSGAPDNALFIANDGRTGIGTDAPGEKLTVNGTLKADAFIGDGSGLTGITGTTGGVSNPENTTIAADTDADNVGEIAFRTQNTSRMVITNQGRIGIGTSSPSVDLEVAGSVKVQNLEVTGSLTAQPIKGSLSSQIIDASVETELDASTLDVVNISISATGGIISGFSSGATGQKVTIINTNQPFTITHDGTGSQKIFFGSNGDETIPPNGSATFICDGTAWYCIGIYNN